MAFWQVQTSLWWTQETKNFDPNDAKGWRFCWVLLGRCFGNRCSKSQLSWGKLNRSRYWRVRKCWKHSVFKGLLERLELLQLRIQTSQLLGPSKQLQNRLHFQLTNRKHWRLRLDFVSGRQPKNWSPSSQLKNPQSCQQEKIQNLQHWYSKWFDLRIRTFGKHCQNNQLVVKWYSWVVWGN